MTKRLIHSILLLIIIFCNNPVFSQEEDEGEKKQIEIIQSTTMEYDEKILIGANRLIGDVIFTHEGAFMFCDSAHFYKDENLMIAYNNVKIVRGDSLLFLCNELEYNGDDKIAKMKDSVILKHHHSYLLTNKLDYDRNTDIATYYDGGKIIDSLNQLTSIRGYYYIQDKDYYAVDSVILINSDYTIYSDTLKYNTNSGIAYFFGKTDIISDSNYMYSEKGYYDTQNNIACFSKNSWLRSGSNYLRGDSLFYDRNIHFGEAFKNVSITDTVENIIAKSDYGYYYENPENALLTENILLLYITNENDTVFLHSDTIRITVDTLNNKLIRAFYKVQIFKDSLQARCDSLTFYFLDSIVHFYHNPIIWAENNKQALADHIYGYLENKNPKFFYLEDNAIVIENIDSVLYNQVSCKNIKAILTDRQIDSVNFFTDVKTIYFIPDDETNEILQQNWMETDNMTVFIVDKALDNLWIYGKTDAFINPIDQIPSNKYKLEKFIWLDEYRPKTKEDIFIWKEIK
ncbi:MAG: hypothetical protein LBV69_04735 [Bacteroidales bacterium]|jgi:hypothetical protein|nr:hypothetical protein [Bacteroidales bacterium]